MHKNIPFEYQKARHLNPRSQITKNYKSLIYRIFPNSATSRFIFQPSSRWSV